MQKVARLEIAFFAIDEEGRRTAVGEIVYEDGRRLATRSVISAKLTGMRKGPLLETDPKSGVMRLTGMFSTMQEGFLTRTINRISDRGDTIYAKRFEMKLDYWPDIDNMKTLQTSLAIVGPG